MESLRATVSGRPAAAIVQMRDPETTRSALIPANSRVRPHDEASDGRAPNRSPTSPNGALHLLPQSLPNSQESNDSFASFVSSVGPRFYASSSNLSQATDLTVPSPVASFERSTQLEGQKEMSRVLPAPQMSSADWRPIPAGFPVTPFIDTNVDGAIRNGASNDTSPTSRTSPASLGGTKRTSSGTVKRPESTHGVLSEWQRGHSRTNSAQSNGSRTGGLAADLKTKLTYAMLKVNNGWQRNNIDQIEQLASQKASPTSATFRESIRRRAYTSPRYTAPSLKRGGSSGSSDSDSYLGSPNTATFTPIKGSTIGFGTQTSSPQTNAWPSRPFPQNAHGKAASASGVMAAHSSLAAATSTPVLAPPADISSPTRNRRSEMSYKTPSLPSSVHLKHLPNSMAPRTPGQNPRATLIRTPTEQARAEKDALDTLMFMSSPGNSASYAHSGQGSRGQQSPFRTEARKAVKFEGLRPVRTPGQSTSSSSAGASPGDVSRNHVSFRKPQSDLAHISDEIEDEVNGTEDGTGPSTIRA